LKKRRDFRKWRTFYIKDGGIDAAFSITPLNLRTKADPNFLKKNIYEINAHFADVSYFVR
jgi:exoribonuclease R